MSDKIRIGICGYGNLGRGVETNIVNCADMELVAVFTRRRPIEALRVSSNVPVAHVDDVSAWREKIDIMILCGGSAKDLPEQTPEFARMFNVVDSFDTHANIPQHLLNIDAAAKEGGNIAIVSAGWDPGLFSMARLIFGAMLPNGNGTTFWGNGVSQGHSDAIRKINGVKNAIQYTIPIPSAMEKARCGESEGLTARDKHTRLCYVVTEESADTARIEREIKEMPNYFADYDTTVKFISDEELKSEHSALPHGGNVIRIGKTGDNNSHCVELSIKLDSNPEFTSAILLAFARAAHRLAKRGEHGAKTVFDIPPILLFPGSAEETVKNLL